MSQVEILGYLYKKWSSGDKGFSGVTEIFNSIDVDISDRNVRRCINRLYRHGFIEFDLSGYMKGILLGDNPIKTYRVSEDSLKEIEVLLGDDFLSKIKDLDSYTVKRDTNIQKGVYFFE